MALNVDVQLASAPAGFGLNKHERRPDVRIALDTARPARIALDTAVAGLVKQSLRNDADGRFDRIAAAT